MSAPVYPSDAWQLRYMRKIAQQIRDWKAAYYYGQPEVDDQQYDLWWNNLLFLESNYPHLKDPRSPSVGVGAPLKEDSEVRRMSLAEMRASRAA